MYALRMYGKVAGVYTSSVNVPRTYAMVAGIHASLESHMEDVCIPRLHAMVAGTTIAVVPMTLPYVLETYTEGVH